MARRGPVAVFHDVAMAGGGGGDLDAVRVRAGVDFLLHQLGLDLGEGNPLRACVEPGDWIVVKPNLVGTQHHHFELNRAHQACVTTDVAVIAPMIEYACRAVGSAGKVLIVDSPIEASDFGATMRKLGIDRLVESFRHQGKPVELLDLRDSRVKPVRLLHDVRIGRRSLNFGLFRRRRQPGDPLGYRTVDVGALSAFADYPRLGGLRFYRPHARAPKHAHAAGSHFYSVGGSVLRAKLIINMPKMKSHKLSGVTLALKNNIGLMNRKMWLPHYTKGWPPRGDQYDQRPNLGTRLQNLVRLVSLWGGHSLFVRFPIVDNELQQLRAPVYNGGWIGNDTLWRTVADVARVVEHADCYGQLHDGPQRMVLSVLDGVIGGEGDGPIGATPKLCGVLAGSFDMRSLDEVATQMMGFDIGKVGYLRQPAEGEATVTVNTAVLPQFHFAPPERWDGLVAFP